MATKQEIIDGIEVGMKRVDATFGRLSDEQLQRKVHEGEHGWTAKEILAHLAGRQTGYDFIIGLANGKVTVPAGGLDADDWNQKSVDARVNKSRDALLQEFNAVHAGLISTVSNLDDEALGKEIELPIGKISLGDVLAGSGGKHSVSHALEVEKVLGLDSPLQETA